MGDEIRALWRDFRRVAADGIAEGQRQGHYRPDVDPALVQGRICACLLDGKPTLKRVTVEDRSSRRTIILRGDNPATPPAVVDADAEFTIQGVVIKLVSRDL